jgi:drug/metabolite transporter (DMT)-like permease
MTDSADQIVTSEPTRRALSRTSHLRGTRFWAIGCLVLGVGIFSLQDLIIKLISADYPLHQAMTIRSLVAAPLLLAMVAADTGLQSIFSQRASLLTVRGLINLVSYTSFYLGLAAIPLANCVALYFTAPLFITLLSALALNERVGPRRWVAVAAGFLGVIVMLRPGSDLFEWAALLPVCAGMTYGTAQVLARRIGSAESAAVMAAYSNFVFLIGASMMAAFFGGGAFADEGHASLAFLLRGWTMPTLTDLLLMMSCGVIAAVALTLLSEAYRSAPANTVAPFEYSALAWSVLYGWLVWGELPDAVGWLGIAIIIGAGLYVLYRESIRSLSRPAAVTPRG